MRHEGWAMGDGRLEMSVGVAILVDEQVGRGGRWTKGGTMEGRGGRAMGGDEGKGAGERNLRWVPWALLGAR